MKETELETFGPITIPCDIDGRKKHISDQNIIEFWNDSSTQEIMEKQGCYIFALKAGRGYSPWYIGKATKNFKQEVFALHKIKLYNKLLWDGKKGTPVMFFVMMPGNLKKISTPVINNMEKFLIQSAVLKNPNVLNSHNTKNLPKWSIKGVVRGKKGKPSEKSLTFKSMMGL